MHIRLEFSGNLTA